MHILTLALESPMISAVVFLSLGIIIIFAVRVGYRPTTILWLAMAMFLWCAYFSLLAISAGPNPFWSRTEIAFPIRYIAILASACMFAWGVLFLHEAFDYSRRRGTLQMVLFMFMTMFVLTACVTIG